MKLFTLEEANALLPAVRDILRRIQSSRRRLSVYRHQAKLAAVDPLKSRLVELRYFAGLTGDQAAEALGISPSAADRHWAFARAWLQVEVCAY